MPSKTEQTGPPTGGFRPVAGMPDNGRRPRDFWLSVIGAESWDQVLDGGTYEIVIPQAKGNDMMDDFLNTARSAVKRRAVKAGRRYSLRTDRRPPTFDTTVKMQMVDNGPAD